MHSKIKIGILTGIFLIQYFCLHDNLPFSKSYPKIESTWSTAKCRQRKSYGTWHYIIICAMLHQNWKQLMFFQTYSEIERTWSINSSEEESESEAPGGAKSKNRHPHWLYCTVVGLSEVASGGVL